MDRKTKEFNYSLRGKLGEMGLNKWQKDNILDYITPIISDHVSDQICGYSYQVALDAFAIVLNEKLGVGSKRSHEIQEAVKDTIVEIDITSEKEALEALHYGNYEENGKIDFLVIKSRIDGRVKPILGEHFEEYDVRYKKAQEAESHHDWDELKRMAKTWK